MLAAQIASRARPAKPPAASCSKASRASSRAPSSQCRIASPGHHVAPNARFCMNCASTGATSCKRPCWRRMVNIWTLKVPDAWPLSKRVPSWRACIASCSASSKRPSWVAIIAIAACPTAPPNGCRTES